MAGAVHWSLILIGATFLFPAEALAQGETTSTIVGQVSAASNAIVQGATLTITNHETGLERSAKTDMAGRFNFPQLKRGPYGVKVEAEGFEPQQNDNVVAHSQAHRTLLARSIQPADGPLSPTTPVPLFRPSNTLPWPRLRRGMMMNSLIGF